MRGALEEGGHKYLGTYPGGEFLEDALRTCVLEHADRDIQKLQVYSSSKVTEDRPLQQDGQWALGK